jgi:hypothetical protein
MNERFNITKLGWGVNSSARLATNAINPVPDAAVGFSAAG